MHDVIAHSLTVTMLHITAARLAVGRGDDEAATEALLEAERIGRTSLTEIRQTVGLLRTEPDGGIEAPQPTAVDIVQLVDGFATAGVDVRLALDGNLADVERARGTHRLPGRAGVAGQRGAPPARIGHRSSPSRRTTTSTCASLSEGGRRRSSGCGPGNGLQGMRERVEALRGTFAAGPAGRGAWLVECRLPKGST